jgi:hypothetical protein
MNSYGLTVYPAPVAAQTSDVNAAREAMLAALLAAKTEIEAGDINEFQAVLAAITGLPDLAAVLTAYTAAKTEDVTAARAALEAAIDAIPPVNLAPVLAAIAAIPVTDIATALDTYGAAKPADVVASHAAVNAHTDSVSAAVKAELAALISSVLPSSSVFLCSSADGEAPPGHTKISGITLPAVVFEQNRFVLTGGASGGFNCSNSTQTFKLSTGGLPGTAYNIELGTTAVIAAWPGTAGYYAGSAIATDDYLYIFGARNSVSPFNSVASVYRLTLVTGVWDTRASLPTALHTPTLVAKQDGTILIIGGVPSGSVVPVLPSEVLGTVTLFNPATNSHTPLAAMSCKSSNGRSLTLANGDALIAFPAASRCTLDGGSIFSTTGRSFLVHANNTMTEVDTVAPDGRPVYQLPDSRVVALYPDLLLSRVFDFSLPLGSQSALYPVSPIGGYATGVYAPANIVPTPRGMLPFYATGAGFLGLYNALALTPNSSSVFYVKKD